MMIKCLIVLLAVAALTESEISDADRTKIIDKFNNVRAAAGGSDMRKLIYDSTVTATTDATIVNDDAKCSSTTTPGKDWVIEADDFDTASNTILAVFATGKISYDTKSDCSASDNPNFCKLYREVVNAKSTKVNCDHKTCTNSGKTYQVIKYAFDPKYSGSGDAFTKGDACSKCGTGYKCECKLCIVDKGGSGVSQLTQNVLLLGLAILCSMLFI